MWDLWLSDASVREQVLSWLAQNDVSVVGEGGRRVRLALPAESGLQREISTLPGVLSMVEHVPPKLFNDVARGLLGVTSDTPGRSLPLTGAGQVVAVADTGLQTTIPTSPGGLSRSSRSAGRTTHPTRTGTAPTSPARCSRDGSASDGTYAGVAPAATLYFQSLLDPRGGLGGLPVSLEELFEPAYQAGARIHNNSWGAATASAYTVDSNEVDDYRRPSAGTCSSSSPRATREPPPTAVQLRARLRRLAVDRLARDRARTR